MTKDLIIPVLDFLESIAEKPSIITLVTTVFLIIIVYLIIANISKSFFKSIRTFDDAKERNLGREQLETFRAVTLKHKGRLHLSFLLILCIIGISMYLQGNVMILALLLSYRLGKRLDGKGDPSAKSQIAVFLEHYITKRTALAVDTTTTSDSTLSDTNNENGTQN